jgi:polyribonucleotide nucleotidyltransferase
VGGISVGLVSEYDDNNQMKRYLTMIDILGSEDHFGDMDFKLCGTDVGVTGFQLDLKLPGIPLSILEEAVDKAKVGRTEILGVMNASIADPKPLSPHAPRIEIVKINPDKIGELIGPGGKNIEDDGTVYIYAQRKESLERAIEMVTGISAEVEIGKTYTGKVVSTTNFGAFMRVVGNKDGLIHISELADFRVKAVEDVVKMGDIVTAKCIGIDDKGRVKMSRRAAMKDLDDKAAGGSGEAPAESDEG